VNADPLIPGSVFGLRTWTVVVVDGRERLAGAYQPTVWPAGGEWLVAGCLQDRGHDAPARGCDCGLHAWHPRRSTARRVLATRGEIAGVLEAQGALELHEEGFRAARARPHALFLPPGGNAARTARIAREHAVEVVPVADPGELLAWCRRRGLGLGAGTADGLRRASRHRRRTDALRVAVAVLVAAVLVAGGLRLATDPQGERVLNGRTGEVRVGD
jgi:hypothetical protein